MRGGRLTKIAGMIASYAPALGRSGLALSLPRSFLSLGAAALLGGIGLSTIGVPQAQAYIRCNQEKNAQKITIQWSCTVGKRGERLQTTVNVAPDANNNFSGRVYALIVGEIYGKGLLFGTPGQIAMNAQPLGGSWIRGSGVNDGIKAIIRNPSKLGTKAGDMEVLLHAAPVEGNSGIWLDRDGQIIIKQNSNSQIIGKVFEGIKVTARAHRHHSTRVDINVGHVRGGSHGAGILAESQGNQSVAGVVINANSVTTSGTGSGDYGIRAQTFAGDVTINVSGSVRSQNQTAIRAKNSNSGAININVGEVTATTGKVGINTGAGIHLEINGGTATVNVGTITAGRFFGNNGRGVRVDGGGTVSFTAPGANPSITSGGDGVYWRAVSSENVNLNLGSTTISAVGSTTFIRSYGNKGIHAKAAAGAIQIATTGSITSAGSGIRAENSGSAAINISAGGSITSFDGALPWLSLPTQAGIWATNSGTSNINITAAGSITSLSGAGIRAESESGSIFITAEDAVTSSGEGIRATTSGSGIVIVNAASVTSQNSVGIHASGNIVTVNANGSVGGGVRVNGTGAISISIAGDSVSTSNSGIGIIGTSASTAAVTVEGSVSTARGNAVDLGGTSINFTASGNVATSSGDGVKLRLAGGNANVTTPSISGSDRGVVVVSSNGGTVTLNTNTISGGRGIKWEGSGSGSATLNVASATIVGTNSHGVEFALAGDTDIDVNLGTPSRVSAARAGVRVSTQGTGNVDLDLSGTITAGTEAVRVVSKNKVTINAARNVTGTVSVDTTGGQSGGIHIHKHGAGNVGVVAGSVTSSSAPGIYVYNRNTGAVTVSAGAVAVSGTGNSGILVKNLSSGGDITVTAAEVTFSGLNRTVAGDGVYVSNLGTGSVSISVSGSINLAGRTSTSGNTRGDGVRAKTTGSAAYMSISVGTVSAQRHGVYANHSGRGRFSMSVSGAVTGGTASTNTAIYVKTIDALEASRSSIVVRSGASVGARSSGTAIKSDGGNLTVNFHGSSNLAGNVDLGGGSDTLQVSGSFTSDRLDGGSGVDLLTISGGVGTAKAVSGWETVNIVSNASATIHGAISVDKAFTLQSSWLSLADGATNAVTIGPAGSQSATFTGTRRGSASATVVIDLDMIDGKADWFDVNGTLTGQTTLRISQTRVPADAAVNPLQDRILVADVATRVSRDAFKLAGGGIGVGSASYKLEFDPNNNKFHLLGQDWCFRQGDPGTGVFICRGTIAAAQTLAASGTVDVVVTMEEDATLNVAATQVAMTVNQTVNTALETPASDGDIDFSQEVGGQIVGGSGIVARNEGGGNIEIELNGRVEAIGDPHTSLTLGYGVHASNVDSEGGSLSIEVKRTGAVAATSIGILALNMGTRDTTVDSDADIAGSSAIHAKNIGGGKVIIKAGGALTGNTGDGVYAFNSVSGTEVEISTSRVRGGRHAIHALNRGSTGVSISISGTAAGGASGVIARNWSAGSIEISAVGTVTGEGRADGHAGIDAENMSSASARLIITATSVIGGDHGIRAINRGTGALKINATSRVEGKRSGVGVGIRAFNPGTDLEVIAATVSGAVHGVHLTSSGTGDLSFRASGGVTGVTGHGIHADNSSSGGRLEVDASDESVSGGMSGIIASNAGTRDLTISAGTVTGAGGYAVRAGNYNGGAVSINLAGDASGSVTTSSSLTMTRPAAISAFNDASGSGLTITAQSVSGAGFGVWAGNEGTGSVSLSVGTVTGAARAGIRVFNAGSSTESTSVLSVTAQQVSGATDGIWVRNRGGGGVSVKAGTVTGTSGYAVNALNYNGGVVSINLTGRAVGGTATGTNSATQLAAIAGFNDARGAGLLITAASASGGEFGIWAKNEGTGSLSIVATGKVAGAASAGIAAINAGSSTQSSSILSISARQVSGGTRGILASHTGGGAVSVVAAGTVSGSKGHGIYGFNANGGALTVTAAEAVSGMGTATVNQDTIRHDGIRAINSDAATTDVSISAAKTVTGSRQGVRAVNAGSGQIMVAVSGTVSGEQGHGIYARNTGDSASASSGVKVTAATVTGSGAGSRGIFVQNVGGGGVVSIVATGNVTGVSDGVRAVNFAAGTTLNVSVGPLDGGVLGTLTVTGGAHGIHATNSGSGDLTIGAGTVTGAAGFGIHAKNESGGSTEVRVRGVVSGSGGTNDGIYASNTEAAGENLEVTVESGGSVSGSGSGIRAINMGTGHVLIRSLGGRISGAKGHGIQARNTGDAASSSSIVTIIAGTVTGSGLGSDAGHGIWVSNSGGGGVSISATGAVSGSIGHGIYASNANGGAIAVTAAEAVSGTGSVSNNWFDGILVTNRGAAASDVRVSAAKTVTGSGHGVKAVNEGSGQIAISVSGAISGANSHGVHASNTGDATRSSSSVTVTVATVTGSGSGSHGIFAENTKGGGIVSVVATGNVTGASDGIRASNSLSGNGLNVSVGPLEGGVLGELTVSGGTHGIHATKKGGGDLTIGVGTVTGAAGIGIYAKNEKSGSTELRVRGVVSGSGGTNDGIQAVNTGTVGGNVEVTVDSGGSVSGAGRGIHASNMGTGHVSVLSMGGRITGAAGHGVSAYNFGRQVGALSSSVTVSVSAPVTGSGATSDGISAENKNGGGVVSIAAKSDVTGGRHGIWAANSEHGTSLQIAVRSTETTYDAAVTGGNSGIQALGSGAGNLSISAGAVTGTASYGIAAVNRGGGSVSIKVAGSVLGGSRTGFLADAVLAGIAAFSDGSGSNIGISAATVTGGGRGIWAKNLGTGAVTVSASGAINGSAGAGVYAYNKGAASDSKSGVTVNVAAVTGTGRSTHGIHVRNAMGGGAVSISALGDVVGGRYGIYAHNSSVSGTSVAITAGEWSGSVPSASKDVEGGRHGIKAVNKGTGDVTISAGAVTGSGGGYGVNALNYNGGSVSIVVNGTAAGAGNVVSDPTGTPTSPAGIAVYNDDSGVAIFVSAATVTGQRHGIWARNRGSGALTLSASNVRGNARLGRGIHAQNENGGHLGINVSEQVVTSLSTGGHGIFASGSESVGVVVGTGAGAAFVGGTVVGGRDGIHAFDGGSGNLSISAGAVTGNGNGGHDGDGIEARNEGGGALSIQVTGDVAGKASEGSGNNTNDGIRASNDSDGTTLSIIAGTGRGSEFSGTRVSGGDHGIFADNSGTGALSISAGVVTGRAGFGIRAKNTAGGRLDINVTGSVSGSSEAGQDGIFASSTDSLAIVVGTGTGTSFVGGKVDGGNDGIRAFGSGSGDLTISAGTVIGRGNDGIDATNMGGGALVLHVTGDVSGKPSGVRPEDNDGIRALNASGATRLEIIAGTGRGDAFSGTGVSGGDDGISATNSGSGALTVSAGSVTGYSGFGVWASNTNGDALSIQATGKIVAKTSATETDLGADRHGVFAYNDASGSSIAIDATAIESHNDGVYAVNRGSGSISISASSITVTGVTTRGGYGVNAFNYNGGAVNVSVTGSINASTNTQKVAQSRTQPAGIAIFNDASGSDVSVTAAAVDGAKHGIWVHNLGSGALSIVATGPVGGSLERNDGSKDTENGGHGVFADNSGTGALGISVAAVNGGNAGIFARNHAGGRLLVTASGMVKGLGNASARQPEKYGDGNGDGIYASNHAAGTTSLTIFAAGAEGFDEGIDVRNMGSDSVTVIATGSVIGKNGDGLRAYNSASGTSMQIVVNSAVGGQNRTKDNPTLPLEIKDREGSGIHAVNRGSGELSITVTGSARSERADVKVADPNSRGDLTYNYDGIRAHNHGGGKVVITVNADVSSEQGDAIDLVNSLDDVPDSAAERRRSEVWIDVAADGALAKVEGGDDGIRARNGSGGDMRINIHGKGTVVGGSHAHGANSPLGLIEFDKEIGHAIWASASGGGDVIINVAADRAGLVSTAPNEIPRSASYVEGHRSGIYARNTGGGNISISIAKSVRGGKFDNPGGGGGRRQGWASVIDTNTTGPNSKTTIVLAAGADVSVSSDASAAAKANGVSIGNGDGDSEVTVNAGASVGNSVALGGGTDTLLFRGGAFRKDADGRLAATQIFDGGEGGDDKLHFAKSASVPTQRVRDLPERRDSQFFYSADMLAANLRNWEEIRFGAETKFRFAGSQTLDADKVQSFGMLTMNNEKAEDRLTVSGNLESDGYLGVDVNFFEGKADLLEVKGDATGETVLVVEDIAGTLGGTGGDIPLVKVDGSVDSSAFTLGERPITAGRGIYGYYLKLLFDQPTGTFRLGGARSGGGVTDTGSIIEATPAILLSGFAKAPGLFMRNLSRLASRSRSVSSRANVFSPATQQSQAFGVNAAAPRLGENAWIWFTAEQEKFQPSDNNGEAESSSHGIRAGLDVLSFEAALGDWTIALTGQYDKVDASSTGLLNKKGRLEAIGYGIGFNATWYGVSNLYVDAQTKVGWIQSELSSDTDGVLISDNASSAWLSSIEIGRHFAIGSTGYINAIPQFQLTAGQLNGGNFVDLSRYERSIDFGSERAGAARLGMALEFTGISGNGYLMSSIVKEFASARDVEIDAVKVSTEGDPDYFEAGLGGSLAIGSRSTIFAEGKYRTSFGGDEKSTKNYGGSINLGVQWQW